jgi:hypothetical protein
MAKRYRVTLEPEERVELEAMIGKGKTNARKLAHARILLQADEAADAPARTDPEIASALDTCTRTVERVRQRFVEEGLKPKFQRGKKGMPMVINELCQL